MRGIPAVVLLLLSGAAHAAGPTDGRGPGGQPFLPVLEVYRQLAHQVPRLPPALPAGPVAPATPIVAPDFRLKAEMSKDAGVSAKISANGGNPSPTRPGPLGQLDAAAKGARKADAAPAALSAAFDGTHGRHGPASAVAPLPAGAPRPMLPTGALPLPIFMQGTDFSCGAASLLSVLWYWGVYGGNESQLYGPLQTTPQHGTEPPKLVEVARSFGLKADMKEGMTLDELRAAVGAGKTVIVDFQAWHDGPAPDWSNTWDDGHYSVVAGIDDHFVYLMDPSAGPGYAYVPIQEFMDRWHDFEDRHGRRQEYRQLGIVIEGERPMTAYPGPLIPVR